MVSSSLSDKQKYRVKQNYKKDSPENMAKALQVPVEWVQAYVETLPGQLGKGKQKLFTAIMVLLPLVILLILELGLRLFHYGGDLNLFVTPQEESVSDCYMCNRNVASRYFFMQSTRPTPQKDLFLKNKPEDAYRIFVMGGSTTAGFPYGNNLMFSRILHKRLCDIFPDRKIEVINTAMAAVNSYTLLDFTDEIIQQKPDAILIYAGHNEYYGAMGVASMESLGKNRGVVTTYLKLNRFRLFLLIRDVAGKTRQWVGKARGGAIDKDSPETLMARIVSDQNIHLDSDLFQAGIRQFESNLSEILKKFKEAGIPVILSELVCNLRDQQPFVSEATAVSPAAKDVFLEAHSLDLAGQYQNAKEKYMLAKDLDALRFRAPQAMNQTIHELAKEYELPVVPMEHFFEAASPNQLVGDPLMTDHLHPNMHGYFIMADAFLQTMQHHGFIEKHWPDESVRTSYLYEKEWGISGLDSAYSGLSIRYLKGGWPFHPKDKPNTALQGYVPASLDERMALRVMMKDEKSLETGLVRLAELYEKNKNWKKAYEVYKALCYDVPYETEFFEKAVRIAMNLHLYSDAFSLLQMAESFRPSPLIHKWLGQLYLLNKEIGLSLPYLEKAYPDLPNDGQLVFNLGKVYLSQLQFDKTKQIIDRLETISDAATYRDKLTADYYETLGQSESIRPLLTKANAAIQQQQWKDAQNLLKKAQAIFPTPTASFWLGQIYLKNKQLDKATAAFEEASRVIADDESVLYQLAVCYAQTKQITKAKTTLRRLVKLKQDFEDPYQLRQIL